MMNRIDKRDRAALFRTRLATAMEGQSQSALARAAGVDRSTISALLADGTRLPNAQLAADCAQALGVSTDWLLGLTPLPDPVESLLAQAVSFTDAPRALFDDTIFGWHKAAAGYKIRHVPATLPDLMKTPQVVEWEYRAALGDQAQQAIAAFQDQLGWLQSARSDYEFALPLHEITSFAAGSGYWAGLPVAARAAQLDHLIGLCRAHYPALRIYAFDAHRVFSSPVTLFGPRLAVIYLGRSFVSFRDENKVAELSQHFDWLVRAAQIGGRDMADYLQGLRDTLEMD